MNSAVTLIWGNKDAVDNSWVHVRAVVFSLFPPTTHSGIPESPPNIPSVQLHTDRIKCGSLKIPAVSSGCSLKRIHGRSYCAALGNIVLPEKNDAQSPQGTREKTWGLAQPAAGPCLVIILTTCRVLLTPAQGSLGCGEKHQVLPCSVLSLDRGRRKWAFLSSTEGLLGGSSVEGRIWSWGALCKMEMNVPCDPFCVAPSAQQRAL